MVWLVKNRAVFFFQALATPLLLTMCASILYYYIGLSPEDLVV
ncbi:hypothetical protein TCA2_3078 [Paenibacillus sp. TCA20]|nr:hypothetical protein TCA2_3078 [Paenibacillus sp. TCA20]